MVTNYFHALSHGDRLAATHEADTTEWVGKRLGTWMLQALCGLHGHDHLRHFGRKRLSLKCVSCGHESTGWELNEARPTMTFRGDPRRLQIARPQLISSRRVA